MFPRFRESHCEVERIISETKNKLHNVIGKFEFLRVFKYEEFNETNDYAFLFFT